MKSEQAAGTQLLDAPTLMSPRKTENVSSTPFADGATSKPTSIRSVSSSPNPKPNSTIAGEHAAEARAAYCGTVAAEFMHIASVEKRKWIQAQMESPPPPPDREFISQRLIRAEMFEQVLQQRYLGNKRFSLEGNTSLIPLLDEVLEAAGEYGAEELVLGMSHRGRLTVLLTIAGRPAEELFSRLRGRRPTQRPRRRRR